MLRLRFPRRSSAVLIVIALVSIVQGHRDSLQAQQGSSASQSASTDAVGAPTASGDLAVPPLIPYSGQLRAAAGKSLAGVVVAVEFSVYDEQQFGTRLWTEVQNVQLDQNGRFSALLGTGSPGGIPIDLFTNGVQRWLEAHAVGQADEPRTLMVSVPYAVKAEDAATLGGKPASAYMLARPEERSTAGSGVTASSNQISAAAPTPGPSGGVTATQFTSTSGTGPSFISQATSGPPLQVSSPAVVANLNTDLIDGFHAAAFPKLAMANTFSATQTIDLGNVDLDPSSATAGNITKNGVRFLHNFGVNNIFLGLEAGNFTMGPGGTSGYQNTAVGFQSFSSNTSGTFNAALGEETLKNNTTGNFNVAVGASALLANTSGSENIAIGLQALRLNTSGRDNTAIGTNSLFNNTGAFRNTAAGSNALSQNISGSDNVAVGADAGINATGSNNIYLGANVQGIANESNAIYIGRQGTQTKTFIAGIRGTTVTGGEPVVIDATGRLGTGAVAPAPNSVGSAEVIDNSLTENDLAANSVTTSELAPDSVTADKAAFNYAGSASEGGAAIDLACVGCVSASEVSFSFASLGANTFTATQTIDTGNLDLRPSTASTGNITKNGALFLHNIGLNNIFLGLNAGNVTMTGQGHNIGLGSYVLNSNTTGDENTGSGSNALRSNTTGFSNTAVGAYALYANQSGSHNTVIGEQAARANIDGRANIAVGSSALEGNTSGDFNTASGVAALFGNTTGSSNVAVGHLAGANATNGSNNIYLGADVQGVANESNTMYLGRVGTQTKTLIAGVRGVTPTNPDAMPVVIDSAGQLGTAAMASVGDVTAVNAGSGLTGGGTVGDLTLALNTGFTDARYASVVHGHDVSQIANAATLGSNSFGGDQTINGAVRASAYRDLAGNPIPTGQDVVMQTPGFVAIAPNTHQQVAAQSVTTTSASDVVVVTYNLVLRNSNPAGTVCPVISYALWDDGPNRQTVIQLMPGVGSGGQTVAFTSSAGNHTVSINAYTSCANMSVDVTGWAGGTYGSTVTTMVIKR